MVDAVRRLQIDTRAESELRRLSGGNQQKVVIARWIAQRISSTLLCFDPTRGIDVGTKRQIYALVREVAEAGAAVLLFTSELPEIPLACDRAHRAVRRPRRRENAGEPRPTRRPCCAPRMGWSRAGGAAA